MQLLTFPKNVCKTNTDFAGRTIREVPLFQHDLLPFMLSTSRVLSRLAIRPLQPPRTPSPSRLPDGHAQVTGGLLTAPDVTRAARAAERRVCRGRRVAAWRSARCLRAAESKERAAGRRRRSITR